MANIQSQELPKDGNVDFSGGMDSSRVPYLLGKNQYARGCNVIIPRNSSSIKNRFGIHHQTLIGDSVDLSLYHKAKNIQGEGYYNDGKRNVLIRVVDGYIMEIRKKSSSVHYLKILNKGDRNNPNRAKAWVTRVPGGAIVNDGQSLPYIITESFKRRSDPSRGEIKVGRMGAYVQNRYYYVDQGEKHIIASDFMNPISLKNSVNTNIYGFVIPEDQDVITAIGIQKASLNYVDGGVLSFSSAINTYSVDVRGDRQNWESQGTNVGKVQESIPGIGAISSYSYESFNSNLWFRTLDYGLMNLKRSEFQFVNDDDYSSQSIEVDYWFSNDSEILLDKCYTRQYRNRLLTTIAPSINSDGFTFWNGLVSMNPDPQYGDTKLPRRFEGIFTGVRPWCMTSVKGLGRAELFIDSLDHDGVTRLYKIEDDSSYDLNHRGERIEIEGWIETKSYYHGDVTMEKRPTRRYYFMQNIKRDLKVSVSSRGEEEGPFEEFFSTVHKVKSCGAEVLKSGKVKFNFKTFSEQSRKKIELPREVDSKCNNPNSLGDRKFYTRQDRFDLKGPYSLSMWIREAEQCNEDKNSICKEEEEKREFSFAQKRDFTYSISQSTE